MAMDPQHVLRLLTATFEDNNTLRTQAEAELKGLTQKHGFCAVLLQIIRSSAVSLDLRKSAAVYLKNQSDARRAISKDRAKPYWDFLSEGERQSVKSTIVEATVTAHPSVQRILEDTIANIAFHE
jgi:hypothetical protein